jgi:hypothetical protein
MSALKGDPKAVRALFKLGQKTGLFSQVKAESNIIMVPPSGDQGKVLRMFQAEQAASEGSTNGFASSATPNARPSHKGH